MMKIHLSYIVFNCAIPGFRCMIPSYVISNLYNKLFVFEWIFKKIFIHYFKVFGYITTQTLIITKITKNTIISTYKIKVIG